MLINRFKKAQAPSRVVVLGSSGFVGSALMKCLNNSNINAVGVTSRDIDLRTEESIQQLSDFFKKDDAVVFVSALTPDKGRDPRTMIQNLKMADHFARSLNGNPGISQLVYVSSDAVYDDTLSFVRESSPCNPGAYHGAMHLSRELILKQAAKEAKTPLLILRPSAIYGAGDTHNSYGPNRFISMAKKEGKIPLFGEGEEKRDHVYIGDLSRLLKLVLIHRSEGVLNAVTGSSVTFRDVAEHVRKLVGESVKVEFSPRANPVAHRHFDTTELMAAFPKFQTTAIETGLRMSV